METSPECLVLIPTYNERENITRIVPAVLEALPLAHVLIIDDNSPDGSGRLADELALKHSGRVFVLHRPGKQGLGRAYLAGFEWGLGRGYATLFEFDADFSHNPRYLPGFYAELRNDADVVIGSRRVAGGGVENWGLLRRFISAGGSLYARLVLGVPIRDLTGGFNGFRREALLGIDLASVKSTGYIFQVDMKYRALRRGFRVVERPIIFPDRVAGKSKMSMRIMLEAMLGVWRLRFGQSVK